MSLRDLIAETSSDLVDNLTSIMLMQAAEHDAIVSGRFIYHNCQFVILKPKNDMNFREVLWSEHRWKRFLREYLDKESLKAWMKKCKGVAGISDHAEIGYPFSNPKTSDGHKNLGSCLWGMSFHAKPFPQLTIMSRVSNLFPVGWLDLSLANLISTNLAVHYEKPVQVVWHVAQLQIDFQWFFSYYQNVWLPKWPNCKRFIQKRPKAELKKIEERYLAMKNGDVEGYSRKRETRLYRKLQTLPDPNFYPSLEGIYDE